MRKISKQIFEGHVTHIMSILCLFFLFSLKTTLFLRLFFLLFLVLDFYLSSTVSQIEKKAFTAEFLTVANFLFRQV